MQIITVLTQHDDGAGVMDSYVYIITTSRHPAYIVALFIYSWIPVNAPNMLQMNIMTNAFSWNYLA